MADRFRNFADMFDGGGMNAAGASFQGSPLSTFANALGIRPAGSEVANPMREVGLMDYFDGGGYGQSGGEFEGSAFSDMMNEMGILPYGSGAQRASERPQMRRPRPTVSYTPDYADRFAVPAMGASNVAAPPADLLTSTQGNPDPLGSGVVIDVPPLEFVAGLGPWAEKASLEDLREAYRLHMQGNPDPLGSGVVIGDGGFEQFVAGLGPIAENASLEDLTEAYRLHMQGYGY